MLVSKGEREQGRNHPKPDLPQPNLSLPPSALSPLSWEGRKRRAPSCHSKTPPWSCSQKPLSLHKEPPALPLCHHGVHGPLMREQYSLFGLLFQPKASCQPQKLPQCPQGFTSSLLLLLRMHRKCQVSSLMVWHKDTREQKRILQTQGQLGVATTVTPTSFSQKTPSTSHSCPAVTGELDLRDSRP